MSGASLRDILRAPAGPVDLGSLDPGTTPLAPGGKAETVADTQLQGERLAGLQEMLYAEGTSETSDKRVLLVLQGMDTCGKDGTVKHVIGTLNPQGCRITGFKAPSEEERRHHFLWRIRRALPGPGLVGIFNRSHYEDVLVVRVHNLVPPEVWGKRYAEINRFEAQLADNGVTIIKCFLHISPKEQRRRLLARLEDPTKRWKFNPDDLRERAYWEDYTAAYEAVLERCSTGAAPWYVVPADRKWYRNWAVGQLLAETLGELNLAYPQPDLDLPALRAQLAKKKR
jgi:PPK2 family polyphosphate:nucleotide phosphotransferase